FCDRNSIVAPIPDRIGRAKKRNSQRTTHKAKSFHLLSYLSSGGGGPSLFLNGSCVPAHIAEPQKKTHRLDHFLEDLGGKDPKEPKRADQTEGDRGRQANRVSSGQVACQDKAGIAAAGQHAVTQQAAQHLRRLNCAHQNTPQNACRSRSCPTLGIEDRRRKPEAVYKAPRTTAAIRPKRTV